jgi:hypothetical protein
MSWSIYWDIVDRSTHMMFNLSGDAFARFGATPLYAVAIISHSEKKSFDFPRTFIIGRILDLSLWDTKFLYNGDGY